jgi:signal transduction histidine kinase
VHDHEDELVFESEMDGMVVVTDEERLTAVISHLIDNALEAIDGEGRVTLRLFARGGDAVIEVEDCGVGMDEDFIRNELFRPFRTTKSGGYGIGAYESREFVQEAGGHMDVISTLGKGTIIRISLPAMQVVQAVSAPSLTRSI